MPFKTLEEAKGAKFPTSIDNVELGLKQVNKLAGIFDAIKEDKEIDDPMSMAIKKWKDVYKVMGGVWVESAKHSIADKETFETVKDVFAVGTWNGNKYTVEDLDEMVDNFKKLNVKVPFKIDLFKDDKLKTDRHGGLPAVGWVKELYRDGEKLYAKITDIPRAIKELIDKKAYRNVSSEIYHNLKLSTGIFRRVLSAVALLGVELHAVDTLDEFREFYQIEFDSNNMSCENYLTYEYSADAIKKEGDNMDLEKRLEEVEKELSAKNKEIEDIKKHSDETESLKIEAEKKLKEIEVEGKKKEFEMSVDKLIEDKKLLPKHKEQVLELMNAISEISVKKFVKEDDKEVEKEVGVVSLLNEFVSSLENQVDTSEKFANKGKTEKKDVKDMDAEEKSAYADELASEIQKNEKCSYAEALSKVYAQNTELK